MTRLPHILLAPTVAIATLIGGATSGDAQPAPPAPPTAPRAPRAPKPPKIKIKHGKLPPAARAQIKAELERALREVERDNSIPPRIKAKILERLHRAAASDLSDLTRMAAELAEMGNDLSEMGDDLARDVEKEVREALEKSGIGAGHHGRFNIRIDDDDDDDDDDDLDDDDFDFDFDFDFDADSDFDSDSPPVIVAPGRHGPRHARPPVVVAPDVFDDGFDLGDVQLSAAQRAELKRIATQEKALVAPVKVRIHALARQLRERIAAGADETELGPLVDRLSAEEAKVRKARLSSLIRTRKLLQGARHAPRDHWNP